MWKKFIDCYNREYCQKFPYKASEIIKNSETTCDCDIEYEKNECCSQFIHSCHCNGYYDKCKADKHYCCCEWNGKKCRANIHKCICTILTSIEGIATNLKNCRILYCRSFNHCSCPINDYGQCYGFIEHTEWCNHRYETHYKFSWENEIVLTFHHDYIVLKFTGHIIKLLPSIHTFVNTKLPNLVLIEIVKNLIDLYKFMCDDYKLKICLSDYQINEIIRCAKIRPIEFENTFENIYNLVDTFDFTDILKIKQACY